MNFFLILVVVSVSARITPTSVTEPVFVEHGSVEAHDAPEHMKWIGKPAFLNKKRTTTPPATFEEDYPVATDDADDFTSSPQLEDSTASGYEESTDFTTEPFYSSQPEEYTSQPEEYSSQPEEYTFQPEEYTSQPEDFNPESENLEFSRVRRHVSH